MKIGILVGMENTFPPALIEKINSMQSDFTAEYVKIGGVRMAEAAGYRLIFDRISHEVPFYRAYLKNAVLGGTIVVNNPFWWSADDKFFNYSLATRLGVTVPKTFLLPQKDYKDGVTDASLRNLRYPLDWDAIVAEVGMPAILKPFDGGGWRDVYKVDSKEDLWAAYDRTGTLCMTLQEFINFTDYVRCYCVGRKRVLVMPYDPGNRRYLRREERPLDKDLEDRIVRESLLLNEALGYDFNTVEFAIRDGIPYAIDFMNPAPDADIWSVSEPYFNWVVDAVANLLVEYAKSGEQTARYHRWNRLLNQDHGSPWPSMAGTLTEELVAGVGHVAETASAMISEVIEQITEPIKPSRARKTTKTTTTRTKKDKRN
jgi:hypothetical protein